MPWLEDNWLGLWGALAATVAAGGGIWAAVATHRQAKHMTGRKMPTIDCPVEEVRGRPSWRVLLFRIGNNEAAGLKLEQIEIAAGEVNYFAGIAAIPGDKAYDKLDVLEATPKMWRSRPAIMKFDLRLQPMTDPRFGNFTDGDRRGLVRETRAYVQLTPSTAEPGSAAMLHAVAICSWTDRSAAKFRVEFTIPLIDIET